MQILILFLFPSFQSSASGAVFLRPFPLSNYEIWAPSYAQPRRWLADWMPLWHYFPRATNFSITFIRMQLWKLTWSSPPTGLFAIWLCVSTGERFFSTLFFRCQSAKFRFYSSMITRARAFKFSVIYVVDITYIG